MYAARQDFTGSEKLLLKHNADVNAKDKVLSVCENVYVVKCSCVQCEEMADVVYVCV